MDTAVSLPFLPKGLFLESPGNFSGPESCVVAFCVCCVYIQDQSFNNFENNPMNLSVNEVKLTGLCARTCATIQKLLILKSAFGPKIFRVFRETTPELIPGTLWTNPLCKKRKEETIIRSRYVYYKYTCIFFKFDNREGKNNLK